MALPSSILTHLHNVTKNWSRLDQVFISDHSTELIEVCNTKTHFRSINMDHLPIVMQLNLKIELTPLSATCNFQEIDWEKFRTTLETQLIKLGTPTVIKNQQQLNAHCDKLTTAIQTTIEAEVPITTICPKSKRWWTKELTQLCRCMNKLGRISYKYRNDPSHPVHLEHKESTKTYSCMLENTKQ